MGKADFRFKRFVIQQDQCAMKVGTDGVLLGAWAIPPRMGRILDVGTGTGLIALMLAQRSADNVKIDAIELDESAVIQARQNVSSSEWMNRISVFQADFRDTDCLNSYYDLIVSNPPFYLNSPPAEDKKRDMARSGKTLSFYSLIEKAERLLTPMGELALIFPARMLEEVVNCLKACALFPYRYAYLHPNKHKEVHRVMLQSAMVRKNKVVEEWSVEVSGRHQYSEEYKRLTRDFYLFL